MSKRRVMCASCTRVLDMRTWKVSELDARGGTRATHEVRGSLELAQLRMYQFAEAAPGGAKLYEVTSDGERLREEIRGPHHSVYGRGSREAGC